MDAARVVVESSNAFVYTAACAYLDCLTPSHMKAQCTVLALRPREPDFSLFCLARDEGSVMFQGHVVEYRVNTSKPLSTDAKPEPFRQLILTSVADRHVLLDLLHTAIEHHRLRVTAPRGQPGTGVMRYVWDDDAQCWDCGKLVPHRSLDTLYLPAGVAEDALCDLRAYLRPETQDAYAALHVAPVRVFMLHGLAGAGKSTLVHCLASETSHNLAVLNFRPHTTDHDVSAAIRNLPAKCFLCIEDIDCLFDMRSNKSHGVSFASLLAALDGVYESGSALSVFLTSNAIDRLDPALRRRVDYSIEFTHATKQQCKRMFAAFYPHLHVFESIWAHIGRHRFSTSVFQKFLTRTLHSKDPLRSLDAFESLIQCTYGTASASAACMYG